MGVPFAKGRHSPTAQWQLEGSTIGLIPIQTRVLNHWPDGSLQWLELTFLISIKANQIEDIELLPLAEISDEQSSRPIVTRDVKSAVIEVGNTRWSIPTLGPQIIESVSGPHGDWLGPTGVKVVAELPSGRVVEAETRSMEIEELGPVRTRIRSKCGLPGALSLQIECTIDIYSGIGSVRLEVRISNRSRAKHKGGLWDLGDPASILFKDLSIDIDTDVGDEVTTRFLETSEDLHCKATGGRLLIYQDSSGGENWDSRNHLNRFGAIPIQFRGFRIEGSEERTHGQRALPIIGLSGQCRSIACTLTEFWQQFPSALEIDDNAIRVAVFPREFSDLHELQAGEENSRVIWLHFGHANDGGCAPLRWTRSPLSPSWSSRHVSDSRAISFLSTVESNHSADLAKIRSAALESNASFFAKREAIDEYGWRHFGDLWADHEGVFSAESVVSHYNNQYDVLYSFLSQYLLTGDNRWWNLADPLARHVIDIDIYHTDRDKSAYNGGLFWHTAHYHGAGLSTHRSYSTLMKSKDSVVHGGGPSNEHNYSSGLLLYYFLTGYDRAREAVIGLADWVISMDSGRDHLMGLVSHAPTGFASSTAEATYHGPGRGAGNSINALLDAWQLTLDDRYLRKCIEIIKRTIHPKDRIEDRDLLNIEARWSYTVFLISIVRFLEMSTTYGTDLLLAERPYVRMSLLHYARWMVENERPYLDFPEELEFPTETWAAQELRKGVVLLAVAQWANKEEAPVFLRRGRAILDQAWQQLADFPTRTLTRPLALALRLGSLEAYFSSQQRRDIGPAPGSIEPAAPLEFTPQKQLVLQALKSPSGLVKSVTLALRPPAWKKAWQSSWMAALCRQFRSKYR